MTTKYPGLFNGPKLHGPIERAVVVALKSIFFDGRHADKVVEQNLRTNRKWGSRDRHQFAETVYEIVRWWRLYNRFFLEREISTEPLNDDDLLKLVRGYGERDEAEIAAAAKSLSPAVRESVPEDLWQLFCAELGGAEPAEKLLHALNKKAPQFLRANTTKTTRAKLAQHLADEGVDVLQVPEVETALRLAERKNVFQTKSYKDGFFEMQDGGSQMIAPLLEVKPGDRVVDACAGAGGKTLHLAALMQNKGRIIALDVHAHKLDELKLRARRAGVSIIETRPIEGTKTIKRLEDSADAVLLDVPCSGLGVLRRMPDTKWKFSRAALAELAETQAQILSQYKTVVKRGGVLVYATCSVLPSENAGRVREFLSHEGKEFSIEKEIFVSPIETDFDGFYAVRLRRSQT